MNRYLGEKKISVVIANTGEIPDEVAKKYATEEQKDPVIFDRENLGNVEVIAKDYVTVVQHVIRYKPNKLALDIYGYLLEQGE